MTSYKSAERMLADVLDIIPYCPEHEAVWSPALVTVLLEAGSQIDSLWRAQARLSRFTNPKADVVDYFTYFGKFLGYRWLVFWGESAVQLSPFAEWGTTAGFTRGDYVRLLWWEAYTKLKHDRLAHRTMASLKNSVAAVAALFLAILHCEQCRDEIAQAKWLKGEQGKHMCSICKRPIEVLRRHYWRGIPKHHHKCWAGDLSKKRGTAPAGYYSAQEVTELLRIGRTTVNRMIERGELPKPHVRGRVLFFRKAAIDRLRG